MSDKEYFSHLYEIAGNLNREFSLHAALRISLKRTVELLNLETGWIWLIQAGAKSVYLAASYNLPPALGDHPERLSGWCFCIEKYLSDDLAKARNISEITCSRLKNIKSGTRDLKFHASIPITTHGQKVGLINLVSKETQQLNEKQLSLLNTIAELIGIAIQRTRLQESYSAQPAHGDIAISEVIERVLAPRIDGLITNLHSILQQKDLPPALQLGKLSLKQAEELQQQLLLITEGTKDRQLKKPADARFHYPASPLTKREQEVLMLVRKGYTNKQIAEQLFIAERTVKFHITAILSKLRASTRTEAVNTAIQRGILNT